MQTVQSWHDAWFPQSHGNSLIQYYISLCGTTVTRESTFSTTKCRATQKWEAGQERSISCYLRVSELGPLLRLIAYKKNSKLDMFWESTVSTNYSTVAKWNDMEWN